MLEVLLLQWGHDEGVVEGLLASLQDCHRVIASMGPRRRRRGRPLFHRLDPTPRRRFNGATTKASWKARRPLLKPSGPWSLQWGHDEGVVEGVAFVLCDRVDSRASMGPRRRRRGRRAGDVSAENVLRASMGPRRRRRGRPERIKERFGDEFSLQWGHDEGVVEGRSASTATSAKSWASMGPRRRRRGRLGSRP